MHNLCELRLVRCNFPYVIGISRILPYPYRSLEILFRLHSTFARLYNAAASPASRLRSAGSLAKIEAQDVRRECPTQRKIKYNANKKAQRKTKMHNANKNAQRQKESTMQTKKHNANKKAQRKQKGLTQTKKHKGNKKKIDTEDWRRR